MSDLGDLFGDEHAFVYEVMRYQPTPPLSYWSRPSNGLQFVYFIKAGDFIKIGISKNPERRCDQLATRKTETRPSAWAGNPQLIGYTAGSRQDEKRLHMEFGEFWDNGEWFRSNPELINMALDVRLEQAEKELTMKNVALRCYAERYGLAHEDLPTDEAAVLAHIEQSIAA